MQAVSTGGISRIGQVIPVNPRAAIRPANHSPFDHWCSPSSFPGTGKTTLIKKLAEDVRKNNIEPKGFYTEELQNSSHTRLGFDIVSFDGMRGMLARSLKKASFHLDFKRVNKLGKYRVHVEDFDRITSPILAKTERFFLIDEIGKMELFSTKFTLNINRIAQDIENGDTKLVATVPLLNKRPSFFIVERLKALDNCVQYEITKENRDTIYPKILESVKIMLDIPPT